MNHLKSILFPLFLTTFLLLSSKYSIPTEARHLLERTTLEHPLERPHDQLPLPQLPHDIPTLPKPELPTLPNVELPPLPEIPKPVFPAIPNLPELPKPDLPKLPELPHDHHDVPEMTHTKLPTAGANNP
ncbi:hypothetical protein FNV43_RR22172 [Rhamnella rubrinervis]|uniref:Uncharacterized protein n=1 Tax=Rhamnella rubrinervis TaxID=2594499 RepID=A0A8K0GUY5_9ROSA|nr:hypothetical protein FNV43_RR22172 [Rhamnella rubrinervis]